MRKMHLWPAAIDADRTRDQGRKISLGIAIHTPTLEEIMKACNDLDLEPQQEKKRYPKQEGRGERTPGCILVEKKHSKLKTLKMVCDHIRDSRKVREH